MKTVQRSTAPDPLLRRGWILLGANLGDLKPGQPKAVQAAGDNRVYVAEADARGSVTLRRAIRKERGKQARRRDKLERRLGRELLARQGVE